MVLKKSNLKPGMAVRNIRTGNIGEVLGKDGKLEVSNDFSVVIKTRTATGKNIGKSHRAFWIIDNLEIV